MEKPKRPSEERRLLKMWQELPFDDPNKVSIEYFPRFDPVLRGDGHDAHRLARDPSKMVRERRSAGLFAHGLSRYLNKETRVVAHEADDYDCLVYIDRVEGDRGGYLAVQLKELPMETVNANQSLDGLIDGLRRYATTRTHVAIEVQRPVELHSIKVPPDLRVSGLWVFGRTWHEKDQPDRNACFIFGSLLRSDARVHTFTHPQPWEITTPWTYKS